MAITPFSVWARQRRKSSSGVVGGVNISRYATDPNHERAVASIFERTQHLKTASEINSYIRARAPKSPVMGEDVLKTSLRYGISPGLILAIMQQDSAFGTLGKGARGRNPGNVGNDDAGNIRTYATWSQGVDAVGQVLANYKTGSTAPRAGYVGGLLPSRSWASEATYNADQLRQIQKGQLQVPMKSKVQPKSVFGAFKDFFVKPVAEFIAPPRGYSFSDRLNSRPTLKEGLLAPLKIGAELITFLDEVVNDEAKPGSLSDYVFNKKIQPFSTPKTPGEAQAMNLVDVLTFIPAGFLKVTKPSLKLIAASRNVDEITSIVMREIPHLTPEAARAIARPLVHVDNADEVEKALAKVDGNIQAAKKKVVERDPWKEFLDQENRPKPTQARRGNDYRGSDRTYEVYTELEVAEAGKRFFKDGEIVASSESSFPDWIPGHLRSRDLIDRSVDHLLDGTPPKGVREEELMRVISDEIVSRGGRSPMVDVLKGEVEKGLKSKALDDAVAMTPRMQYKNEIRVIKKETMDKARAIYNRKISKIQSEKDVIKARRHVLKAVQKNFGLTHAEFRSINKKDLRFMTNQEFGQFLKDIQKMSEDFAVRRQAKNELIYQIESKELKIDSIRQALKFPPISKMTTGQLREMSEILDNYQKGDVFFSKRKLEVVDRTSLEGAKTYREVRNRIAEELKTTPDELTMPKMGEWDRFKGQAALSEKHPLLRLFMERYNALDLIRQDEYLKMERELNRLARKLPTGLVGKAIPQQKNIAAFIDAADKSAINLSPEEAELMQFMLNHWDEAREYLVQYQMMKKGIKNENYYTHLWKGALETLKDKGVNPAGILEAGKALLRQHQLDDAALSIVDRKTGEILSADKHFRFAMRRTGEVDPSQNVVEAFRTYFKIFKRKQVLDEIGPWMDIVAESFAPKGLSKDAIKEHENLMSFVKEWMNTQKGQRVTILAKPGGKLEWAIRAGNTFVSWLDIAGNMAVTAFTPVGEQVVQYVALGKARYALAKYRAATPRGKRVISKYRNEIGKNPWGQLVEPARALGDRLTEGVFVTFRDANIRRNRNILLGSMSKEEWATETLSPERLAQLKLHTSRWGVVDGMGSILGATPEAETMLKYRQWAVTIMGAELRNVQYMTKYLATKGQANPEFAKRAMLETWRSVEIAAFVAITWAMFFAGEEDDNSFSGRMKKRFYQEALTLYGAFGTVGNAARLPGFLTDMASNLITLIKLEKYEASKFGEYEVGQSKGLKYLKRQFTPKAVRDARDIYNEATGRDPTRKTARDVAIEIKKDLEEGRLDIPAAKEKLVNELEQLERADKERRLALPPKEYAKEIKALIQSEDLTIEDAKEEFLEYMERNAESLESPSEGEFLDKIILYANAFRVDPVTAFIMLAKDEKIRRIDNGAIVVYRMPYKESQKIREQMGATKDLVLDHRIPLQLGGSNSKSNLRLVTVEDWERYTVVENFLGERLRAGMIEKDEAQDLIKAYKDGVITAEDIMK